jgi:pimeloyl-ACP methyl ester carboxylesterase
MMSFQNPSRLFVTFTLLLAGCSTVPRANQHASPLTQATVDLRQARRVTLPTPTRAALYLNAAALADAQLDHPESQPKARAIYNNAAGELTELLRDADGGELWNQPLVMTARGVEYRLKFAPKTKPGTWSPNDFTGFKLPRKINYRHVRYHFLQEGVGGPLVGIHKTPCANPLGHAPFEPKRGLVAPVTATLDFQGRDATLTLSDPTQTATAPLDGKPALIAADYTAPIAFHPPGNPIWRGLMGLIQVEKYMSHSGLYMLEPYDPNRIPVILIHGLMSTPEIWVNDINELEADPRLRGRFQYWVFGYPTGNPPAYSALICREELQKIEKIHPLPHGCILIGHSMGGLVARMQATNTGRVLWDGNFKDRANRLYAKLPADHVIKRSLICKADPQVKEIVFICVPHRGSQLALSPIGALGQRLISLPSSFVSILKDSIVEVLQMPDGKIFMPNSISGLSPKSPTLLAMDQLPISAPCHSIVGDRGRGDTPNSSDGVVPYWSSHLDFARSEKIVPGPHSSQELPQTIDELKRILGDHLQTLR